MEITPRRGPGASLRGFAYLGVCGFYRYVLDDYPLFLFSIDSLIASSILLEGLDRKD